MSKKEEIKLSDDLENDLDSFLANLDLDDDIDLFEETDERQPLTFENLKKATAKEFKKPPTLDQVGKALEETLPEAIHPEYDILKDTISTTKDTVTKNIESLKKEMLPITKAVEKMSDSYLGNNSKLKKIFEYLKPTDSGYNSYSRGKNLEGEVEEILRATLGNTEDISNKINAINQVMADRRSANTNDILKEVQRELTIGRVYTTDVTAPFQRKSLELQYRSNFYLKEILEQSTEHYKEHTELLKSIMKNTGLPDVVKQRQMEMLGADMRQQFRYNIMDKFITNNPLLTKIKTNINNKIKYTFNQLRDSASDISMGIEMAGDSDDIDKNQLLASMVKDGALKAGFSGINKLLLSNNNVVKGLSKFKQVFDDPDSMLGGLKSKIKGDGIFSETMRSMLGFGQNLVRSPAETGRLDTRRLNLDSATTLDVRTKMAVNKVIPGYLKKIHAEIKANRMNFKGPNTEKFELSYSHAQEKFVSSGSLGDILKKNIAEQMQDSTKYSIARLSRHLSRAKSGVNEDVLENISKHLALASTKTTKTGLGFLNSEEAKSIIPKHLQKDYNKLLNAVNKKAESDLDYIDDMRRGVDNVRRSIPNINKFFEELIKNGDIATLENLGIVKYDSLRDMFIPNEANILKMMFETYGITDPESLKNATGEVTYESTTLGRKLKKEIVKGRKKYREVKKAVLGDEKAQEELKKEVKKAANKIKEKTKKALDSGKGSIQKTLNKEKKRTWKTKDNIPTKDQLTTKAQDVKETLKSESNQALETVKILKRIIEDDINSALTSRETDKKQGTIGKNNYFKKTEEEKEEEVFDQIVKEKGLEFKALMLIDSAIESNSNEALEEVKKTLKHRGMDKSPTIKKKLTEVDKYLEMKKNMGKEALKGIDPKKDPEGANRSLLGLMKSGLGMIPFGKTIGLIGKSTWWLMKRGWKNEAWLAKNLYWPVLKGIAKTPLALGKGLWGLGKLTGKGVGKAGKFAVGTGRKMAHGAGSLFLNSMSRMFTGKNLIGDTLFGTKKKKKESRSLEGQKGLLGKAKEKLINGMTKEEYEKKKGRGKKKKPGLFKQLLGMLMKVGSGLLGAVTMLGGKVGLLAMKALPALVNGIGAIGGKIAGFFKSPDAPKIDPKNPKADPKGPKPDPKKPSGGKKGLLDRIKDTIKGIKDKIVKPIAKKIGPKGALKIAGKIAKKLIGMLTPGLGWGMLLWSVASIGLLVAKGKSLASAICEELIGFDPWDDNAQVLDENGNPVKPDPEDLKAEEEKNKKEEEKTGTEVKIEKPVDPTYPKNAEEMMKYGMRPAELIDLAGMSDEEIKNFRKEEQFQFLLRKSNWDGTQLSESDKVRNIYLTNLMQKNGYIRGQHKLLAELGKEADSLAKEKFGDQYTPFDGNVKSDIASTEKQISEADNKSKTQETETKDNQPQDDQYSQEEDEERRRAERTKEQAKINEEALRKYEEEERNKTKNTTSEGNITTEESKILDGAPRTIPEQTEKATVPADAPGSPIAEKAGEIASENAETKSTGSCARYVRTALEQAGYQEPPGRPLSAYQYETTGFINKYGFSKIDAGNPLTFKPKPGDISITKAFNEHKHGHIAIFDGKNWVSDFKQRSVSIYRDLPQKDAKDYISIYRDTTKEGSGGDCADGYCPPNPNVGYNLHNKMEEQKQDTPLNVNHDDLIAEHDRNTGRITEIGNITNQHLTELIEINRQLLQVIKAQQSTGNQTNQNQAHITETPNPVTDLSRNLTKNKPLIGSARRT